MNPNIGIEDNHRNSTVILLKEHLADAYILFTKTKFYHWNVTGKFFKPLHEAFDGQAGEILEIIDAMAERIRALGQYSTGTLHDFLKHSQLKEDTDPMINDERMLRNLLADHEAIIVKMRKSIDLTANQFGDAGTSDFLTGTMEKHEKIAWMLRSHLV